MKGDAIIKPSMKMKFKQVVCQSAPQNCSNAAHSQNYSIASMITSLNEESAKHYFSPGA